MTPIGTTLDRILAREYFVAASSLAGHAAEGVFVSPRTAMAFLRSASINARQLALRAAAARKVIEHQDARTRGPGR